MIIVTGATGLLGHAIVEQLLARVPANQVGVSVRDPLKCVDLEKIGVRVRRGDFQDPESLHNSFEDAHQLLIVSSNARATGGDPIAQHQAAIEVAKSAGVSRIFYTSHMAASFNSAFSPMRDHAATEEMLKGSGIAWTGLRNGFYASSGVMLMGDAMKTGMLSAPADGKVSWTAHGDLAEAAAILLTRDEKLDGPTPPLTECTALDLNDLAVIASDLWGKSITRKAISDDEFKVKMIERGAPAASLEIMLSLYTASRKNEFSTTDPFLEQLLGRKPTSIREIILTLGNAQNVNG